MEDREIFNKIDFKKEKGSLIDKKQRRLFNMLKDWDFLNSNLCLLDFQRSPQILKLIIDELADKYHNMSKNLN